MKQTVTQKDISHESMIYRGSGGVSAENRAYGFRPAFFDRDSGRVYLACDAGGTPSAVHCFDGLPDDLVMLRDESGRPTEVKSSVTAGFVREGCFFTREQAAQVVQWELDQSVCGQRTVRSAQP